MRPRIFGLLGLIIILLSVCSGTNNKYGLLDKDDFYLSDTLSCEIKTILWYSANADTTIIVDIYRSGEINEDVHVNISINPDSSDRKIENARLDAKPNIFKYSALLASDYYRLPGSYLFKKGEQKCSIALLVKKNALLNNWDGALESYILPVTLSPSSPYANIKSSTAMVVFSRMKAPGTVIAHIPASEKKFIGSPSICIMPNGNYIASHDENTVVNPTTNNITHVYRSEDKGKTWAYMSKITGQFWSSVFVYQGDLYIHGPDKVAGKLVIRKSTDYGKTWTNPDKDTNGLLLERRISGAPTPVIFHKERIWRAIEDASFSGNNSEGKWRYQAMMTSAPMGSDLLDASNWTTSNTLQYDSTYLDGKFGGWLEGNAVAGPDGKLHNILRVEVPVGCYQYAALVSISDDGKTASFDPHTGFFRMAGGASKFTIRYDELSKKYYTLTNYNYEEYTDIRPTRIRNVLVLMSSDNIRNWKINRILLRHSDVRNVGFQYVDWQFDGEDIIFTSRTSYPDEFGGAMNYHNANYLTFHRIFRFRDTKETDLNRNTT
ncbi:DUF1735 domain-containing protein [uncultured Dysgonomonas sp.]|uniref:Periplasmic protein (Modular protein) n=1 Tax=uncultured Dysgonomonas sp. TaxID=206096 RepID=A0A212JCP4_9BACT|nr:DUF1735 domain-containing protein [uncultured Dysgonomonas sp.]SBV97214.1 Periplasmic protein (modular protein) [uncultured Dysgonomonas sp.]